MSYDGLFFRSVIDPNGIEHQIGDVACSGCAWNSPQPLCDCGGLNHYWLEDEDDFDSYVAYECDRCGMNESLTPSMNEGWV